MPSRIRSNTLFDRFRVASMSVEHLPDSEVVYGFKIGNKKQPICGQFCYSKEPSDGLEPSTPSLPWRFRGGNRGHDRASAATFFLQIRSSGRVNDART